MQLHKLLLYIHNTFELLLGHTLIKYENVMYRLHWEKTRTAKHF